MPDPRARTRAIVLLVVPMAALLMVLAGATGAGARGLIDLPGPVTTRPPATSPPVTSPPTTSPPPTTAAPATTRPAPVPTRAQPVRRTAGASVTSSTAASPSPLANPAGAGPVVTSPPRDQAGVQAGVPAPTVPPALGGQAPAPAWSPGTDGVTSPTGNPRVPPPAARARAERGFAPLAWAERGWRLLPMGLAGLLSWSVWLVRRILSRLYRPVSNLYRTSTSVVVPVYREDPEILERCLRSWLAEGPDELLLVVDLADRAVFERLAACDDPRLRVLPFAHSGKRSALGHGIRQARHDLVVLADSDTEWEPGLLRHIQMPFVDPAVGGVGTRQRVYLPDTSVWRRVAAWMLNTRYLDYVPAMGRAGAVACLSGRTAAYRRSVIAPVVPELEHEVFMGRECVAGDDGRLTWLVLRSGFRTVHQDTARASSMFPDTFSAFVKQRLRWSRNSYRCYLTAMARGWLWRQPFVTQLTVLQILLTPVSMATTLVAIWLGVTGSGLPALWLALGWLVAARSLRGFSHLRRHPRDVVLAPLVAVMVVLVALPIKLWALLTMNQHGWLTRQADRIGAEGQDQASLTHGGSGDGSAAPTAPATAQSAHPPAQRRAGAPPRWVTASAHDSGTPTRPRSGATGPGTGAPAPAPTSAPAPAGSPLPAWAWADAAVPAGRPRAAEQPAPVPRPVPAPGPPPPVPLSPVRAPEQAPVPLPKVAGVPAGHELPGGGWSAPAGVPFAAPPWERVLPGGDDVIDQVIDLWSADAAPAEGQPGGPWPQAPGPSPDDDGSRWRGLIETAEFAGPVERAHA